MWATVLFGRRFLTTAYVSRLCETRYRSPLRDVYWEGRGLVDTLPCREEVRTTAGLPVCVASICLNIIRMFLD